MSTNVLKVNAVKKYIPLDRLEASINTSSRDGLEELLKQIHSQAVLNAPERKSDMWGNMKLLDQIVAKGLLKNSIVYSVDGKELKGANSVDGAKVVYGNEYIEEVGGKFSSTKSTECKGFVGTFVNHSAYENWDDSYKAREYERGVYKDILGDSKREASYDYDDYEIVDKTISDSTAYYPYGTYVEFNVKPFLRPAVYNVIDSEKGNKIYIDVFKRDIPIALKSGFKEEQMRVIK